MVYFVVIFLAGFVFGHASSFGYIKMLKSTINSYEFYIHRRLDQSMSNLRH